MKHQYDLFERFPDGSSLWRACVIGLEGTRRHMRDLAQTSPNQFYALHLATGKVILLALPHRGFTGSPKANGQSSAAAA